MPSIIPPERWKKVRNRLAHRARRGLHIMESDRSGLDRNETFVRRYDYIATPAEITVLVEMVMTETERECGWRRKLEAPDA